MQSRLQWLGRMRPDRTEGWRLHTKPNERLAGDGCDLRRWFWRTQGRGRQRDGGKNSNANACNCDARLFATCRRTGARPRCRAAAAAPGSAKHNCSAWSRSSRRRIAEQSHKRSIHIFPASTEITAVPGSRGAPRGDGPDAWALAGKAPRRKEGMAVSNDSVASRFHARDGPGRHHNGGAH